MAGLRSYTTIEVNLKDQVLWVALNREEVRNAFNEVMISELLDVLRTTREDRSLRVLVLTGKGKAF